MFTGFFNKYTRIVAYLKVQGVLNANDQMECSVNVFITSQLSLVKYSLKKRSCHKTSLLKRR